MAGFTIFETTISFTKSILVSLGVILFKVSIIPKLATLPPLCASFKLWFSPLHVFIVLNLIMFAVAASSAFCHRKDTTFLHVPASPPDCFYYNNSEMISNQLDHVLQPELGGRNFPEKLCAYSSDKDEEDAGGDSMDATWKAIVESQAKQTPKVMQKSQTWDSPPPPLQPCLIRADHADEEEEELVKKKSERLHQTLSLRRKISMTSEELRSRAEAFIEMVNRSIRLQRQQSEQRFLQAMKHSV